MDDLVMRILLFLPAKSLIRFKSVCKKWLSLISSDHFCHQHTLRRPKLQQSIIIQMHEKLFYLDQTTKNEKVMIPYSLSVLDPHKIVEGCHGLLVLESKHRKNSYYVYNPTTRRLRKIILTKRDDFPCFAAITLAFDPSKSPYYKLVYVRSNPNPTSYTTYYYDYLIEVYDSESHTWKLSLNERTNSRLCNNGTHWNNCIFWNTLRDDQCLYFCFDIAKNEISMKSFDKRPYESHDVYSFLGESNGHLYFFVAPGLQSIHLASIERLGVVWKMGGDAVLSKYLGKIHAHRDRDYNGQYLMLRSNGDGSTCSVITYEPMRMRIMAYNYLDGSDSELLVNLTGQPFSHVRAFQFGEILALV